MNAQTRILMKTALISGLMATLLCCPLSGMARTRIGFSFLDQELNSFLQAKDFIFTRAWARAVNALQAYLKTYPAGRYGDEAEFWLAKALDGLAGEERTTDRVLDRKAEAVTVLNRLAEEHPKSPWLEEARPLRKKLLSEIALIGGTSRRSFLAGFLKDENKTLDQVRLDTIDTLLTWDRGWAAPVIEDLLKTVGDPEGRKKTVRFAARYFPDETESFLRDAAARDADAGVRAEAAAAIERLEMARIPVDALFFIFAAQLTDKAALAMVPENTARLFDLAPAAMLNNKDAEKKADMLFNGKLRQLKMKSGGSLDLNMNWLRDLLRNVLDGSRGTRLREGTRIVAGDLLADSLRPLTDLRQRLLGLPGGSAVKIPVGDVTVAFPLDSRRKTADSVSGQIVFESGTKEYPADFSVHAQRDQLAAFRRGNDVWLVVLQYDSRPEESGGFPRLRVRPQSAVIFQNVLGCKVESSRGSWSFEEMTGGGLIDFGQAKVEIPAPSGRWRLEGFLQADKTKRAFIGRNAELFDPSGKLVVQAAEIIVPAGAPDKYEIVKK